MNGYNSLNAIKEAVYKKLGLYTENGERVSLTSGTAADIEQRFLQTLSMCLHRVCMSFPLKTNNVTLYARRDNGETSAVLPSDVFRVLTVKVRKNGESKQLSSEKYGVLDGKLYLYGEELSENETVSMDYTVLPVEPTENASGSTVIELPPVTRDALIYLTAAELCPLEESERYTRLVYAYRDMALNVYNIQIPTHGRNTFYTHTDPRRGLR